jgi:starch synthase
MGDVIAQAAMALARAGCRVTVMTPSHGFLHALGGAVEMGSVDFLFRSNWHRAALFEVPGSPVHEQVRHLVVHHPLLDARDPLSGAHRVYLDDPPDSPFAGDASRFALFCAAVAAAVPGQVVGTPDVLHLHDWHAALLLILRKFNAHHRRLRDIRTVFSIHNLALQGIRPLRGHDSSLEAWYPGLPYDWFEVADPRWPDCVNPMAAGIRLADVVHTVSPSYAEEILHPGEGADTGGGEGLEAALRYVSDRGKLTGILNGCDYPQGYAPQKMPFGDLLDLIRSDLIRWAGERRTLASSHFIAQARLMELERLGGEPDMILTSVGRVVAQKIRLMRERGTTDANRGLARILAKLGRSGVLFLLGTGDEDDERFLTRLASRHDNFIFLNGYSDACARALYANGDLFLMPSTFEPCGISQMLAMRDGQPCVVHAVGGLKDTVRDRVNGFSFAGGTRHEQVDRFVQTTLEAVSMKREDPDQWEKIRQQALATRFPWSQTAREYLEKLYPERSPEGMVKVKGTRGEGDGRGFAYQ